MGCDIHFYVEKKVDDRWVKADAWDESGSPYYECRNYDLFAILADVRNDDGFNPICQPRGLPSDVSHEVKEEYSEWGDHSHSWVTVKELIEYDWTQKAKLSGWVSAKEYARFILNGSPNMWSSGVSGRALCISNDEMMSKLKEHSKGDEFDWEHFHSLPADFFGGGYYTRIEWERHYYQVVQSFLYETMPRLWTQGEPDCVRCVYWFDN